MGKNFDADAMLTAILKEFDCQTGTIHRTTESGDYLDLVSQVGVPEFLLEKVSHIPFGKGIAGAAAERCEPVELCNLQQDLGGVAKPDARQTGVAGSIAVPVVSSKTGKVLGTLGIGKIVPHEFSDDEKTRLAAHAEILAENFAA